MLITGKLEVFKNQRGYVTGIFKAFDEFKHLQGKVFIDVAGLDIKDERTYTIDVIEGYLNAVHVASLTKDFDKLVVNVVKHKLISVYPDDEKKDESQEDKEDEDELPF